MLTIGGLVLLFGCVLGSYIVSGGSMEPLIEAVPFEMWTIGGAALATMLMANSIHD
ncbi:MAG: chemotaxis protein MotA, partial [Acetobacteraceae bacterium]|nr:chemotaxis protein MotA [Acetobacteraceae bacterium]